jgi:hypothetical protein
MCLTVPWNQEGGEGRRHRDLMPDNPDEDSTVSSEELALERWEDDGGRVGPHPQPDNSPPPDGCMDVRVKMGDARGSRRASSQEGKGYELFLTNDPRGRLRTKRPEWTVQAIPST